MSENLLNTQIDGTTIQAAHVNQYKTALVEDVLPRNLSGQNEDEAGSLGSDIYRWFKGIISTVFTNKLSIGAAGDETNNPFISQTTDNLNLKVMTGKGFNFYINNILSYFHSTSTHDFYIGGVLKSQITTNGLDGAYLKAGSVSSSKLASITSGYSAQGSGSTTSTTYVLCSSCSVTISCSGTRPIYAYIQYLSAGGYFSVTADAANSSVRIINTTTNVTLQEYGIGDGTEQLKYYPHGGFDAVPNAGNNTYRIEAKTPSANVSWADIRLVVHEL